MALRALIPRITTNNSLRTPATHQQIVVIVENVNVMCLPAEHQIGLGARWKVSVRSRSDWNLEVLVFVEGWKLDNSEQGRTLQLTNNMPIQPTCNFNSGNRTRDTLVATVPSCHHCAIRALHSHSYHSHSHSHCYPSESHTNKTNAPIYSCFYKGYPKKV